MILYRRVEYQQNRDPCFSVSEILEILQSIVFKSQRVLSPLQGQLSYQAL